MKHFICSLLYCLYTFTCWSQIDAKDSTGKNLVNLYGEDGTTILVNKSRDTVKLSALFFTYLPYAKSNFDLVLPPGGSDTLTFNFYYPDFIFFKDFRLINGPGRKVVCLIEKSADSSTSFSFQGDFTDINYYYARWCSHFNTVSPESTPYYAVASNINDMRKFSLLSDSIERENLEFLKTNETKIPTWFLKHEAWRIKYNSSFRKYNIAFSKEASGQKIQLEPSFYDFENELPLSNEEMAINTEYLFYVSFYFNKLSHQYSSTAGDPMISAIDNKLPKSALSDALKLKRISDLYISSNSSNKEIRNTMVSVPFSSQDFKDHLNSLLETKLSVPKIGSSMPNFYLENKKGEQVKLSSFAGRFVIINFWASWCSPCLQEFKFENELYTTYLDQELTVINISVQTSKTSWLAVSTKFNLKMVDLWADEVKNKKYLAEIELSSLPRSILLDKKGKVVDNHFKRASLIKADDIRLITLSDH